jgi:hypothetical protein
MVQGFWRTTWSGVLASLAFAILSVVTFYAVADVVLSGILSDPAVQSPKVIAVLETLEPLPRMRTAPYIIFAGWTGFLIGWAFLFKHISVLWPPGYWARLWRLALLIWFFSLSFFEFMAPYNLLAEPLPLLALELLFWAICALGAAAVIVAMTPRQPRPDLASAFQRILASTDPPIPTAGASKQGEDDPGHRA